MTGYSPTHIPIPKNHADFERKATVLFREILKDPDAKRLGSEGQSQYGIDIVGFDGGNTSRIVGIQCKKKKPNEILTAKEVRDELRMALKYKPAICKYIIVTTARKDRRLEQLAQTLTQQQKAKGRKVKVEVWGWDLVEDRIDDYPAAIMRACLVSGPAVSLDDAGADRLRDTGLAVFRAVDRAVAFGVDLGLVMGSSKCLSENKLNPVNHL
jgi:hypothetical protein